MNAGADYKVVRDDHFDLDEGERRELLFDLPPDQLADQPLIVAWKSRPLSIESTGDVEISVALKFQAEIDRITLREDTVRGLWEVFPHGLTSDSLKETLIFESHRGRISISDVVVWFQRTA
jgi:hypothetical protein